MAVLGLTVNVASAWLLSGGDHHHGHSQDHGHHASHQEDEGQRIATGDGELVLEIYEDGVPPRFRLRTKNDAGTLAPTVSIETVRPDGARQSFALVYRGGGYLESIDEIPEPHAFRANVKVGKHSYPVDFDEHEHAHGSTARDHNMRAAAIHVLADATVSVLVIVGLLLARSFGWLWMDPLAGIIGACVIASWSFGLIRDTGAILLDMNPNRRMADSLRRSIESDGDQRDFLSCDDEAARRTILQS